MENNIRNLLKKINNLITIEQVLEQILDNPRTIEEKDEKIKSYCPIHGEKLLRTLIIDIVEKTFKCSYTYCAGYRGGDLFTLYCLSSKTSVREAIDFWAKKLCLEDTLYSDIEVSELESLTPTLLQRSSRTYFMPHHTSAKLTGAFVKDSILISIQRELDRAYRYNRALGFILLRIENLDRESNIKTQVLYNRFQKLIEEILNKSLRTADTWAQYGSDRYAIVLPETNKENTAVVSQKLKVELIKNFKLHPDINPFSANALAERINYGVSGISQKKNKKQFNSEDLLNMADQDLKKNIHDSKEIIEK